MVPAPTTPIVSVFSALIFQSPSQRRFHHRDTTPRFLVAHHVSSTHTASSSTVSIPIARSRGPTPPRRHSRLPSQDLNQARVLQQAPRQKMLHSTQSDRLHYRTSQSSSTTS